MIASICQYAKDCPIFQGKENASKIPLRLYQNVFCKRGSKGWNNCERYHKLKGEVLRSAFKEPENGSR